MASSPEKDPVADADRVEAFYTLEEVAKECQVSIDDLMRRISEGTIQGVQKGDQWLIPHEEMKKLADESLEKPNGEPLSEWEVNGLTALTVPSSETGDEKEDSRINRARELFSEWLKGLKHAKWNDKWDVKVKGSTSLTVLSADQEEEKEEPWRNRAKELFSDWLNGIKNAKWNEKLDEKAKEWIGRFFQIVERLRKREVEEEGVRQKVSLKLGIMTGRKEMNCDFCQVTDHFYPGALFADIYVDGELKWVMCPNCLWYCREQSNGSLEKNVRARFNHLAYRLEQEARRARRLAASEDFRVPSHHEWEAWETASYALKEVASTYDVGVDDSGFADTDGRDQ